MRAENGVKEKSNWFRKMIIIAIFIGLIAIVISIAPNYIKDKLQGKINVIINNSNVTNSMKLDVFVNEDNVVYMATKDIANFFDEDIFYDNVYDQIITSSDTKLATLKLNEEEMYVNSSKVEIHGAAIEKDDNFYLPFSEMKDVYNVDINYIEESKILVIDSLDKKQERGNVSKDINIKYEPTNFSKTVDTIKKGNSIVVIEKMDNGWYKVRTNLGRIGYTKDVTNIYTVREDMESAKQIEGKVSLVWDYYSEYADAPNRQASTIKGVNVVSPSFASLIEGGKGKLFVNIGEEGKDYINWAHTNGYKVWPIISNNSYKTTTSEVLNDYKLREKLINDIVDIVLEYNLDGINIDFEYMNMEDKDEFSRFVIELAPRLKEYSKVLSVDVTAPDGSDDWSMCYDRNKLGEVADYVIFMAYDQNGISSPEEGTTAGADWVEVNIKKFIGTQEEVPADKLILGMPFYTRLWKEVNGTVTSGVVTMKNIDSKIPAGVNKTWDEDLKQYYVEYEQDGVIYKMWLEEEESIKAKFALMKQYDLAGAAYWQKDFEKSTIWDIVEEELN